MKNTNLFNFQNGMAYALATLGFDNAIPYEPIIIKSDFFEVTEDRIIIPKNQDKWADGDSMCGLGYYYYNPSSISYINKISLWQHFTTDRIILSIDENYKIKNHLETDWDEIREIVPLFLSNENNIYDSIVVKFRFTEVHGNSGDKYWYGWTFKVGIINLGTLDANGKGDVVYDKEYIQGYSDLEEKEIVLDISELDHVDFLTFYGSTAGWEITEMRLV